MNEITFSIANSYVKPELKEVGQTGKGEAKIFLSTVNKDKEIEYEEFFNKFDKDNKYYLRKENLLNYLKEVKLEYVLYFDNHNGIDEKYYKDMVQKIENENDQIIINIKRFGSDSNNRYYIKPDKNVLIRQIAIPSITCGRITKKNNEFCIELFLCPENKADPNENIRKEEFRKFLINNKEKEYSNNTADKYKGRLGVSQFINTAKELGYKGRTRLYNILEVEEWNKIKKDIESLPKFNEVDKKQRGELSAALNAYTEYLKYRANSLELEAHNIVFNGAPGTGKSYSIDQIVKFYYPECKDDTHKDSEYVFRTTLHEEFMYSDFVGQILPKVSGESVTYEFVPGIFSQALKKANEDKTKKVFLILEELSRANVAAVFGDIFQLLDRDKDGESEYKISQSDVALYLSNKDISTLTPNEKDELSKIKIYIPSNLYIYCTANLSDQNVFVMDTAFKRRFEWKYITTQPEFNEKNGEYYNNPEIVIDGEHVQWCEFYQKLNSFITDKLYLPEDKQIGQFFIKFDKPLRNKSLIQNKLLQYLWEDIHKPTSDGEVKLFKSDIKSFSKLYEKYGKDEQIFSTAFHKLGISNTDTISTVDTEESEEEEDQDKEE